MYIINTTHSCWRKRVTFTDYLRWSAFLGNGSMKTTFRLPVRNDTRRCDTSVFISLKRNTNMKVHCVAWLPVCRLPISRSPRPVSRVQCAADPEIPLLKSSRHVGERETGECGCALLTINVSTLPVTSFFVPRHWTSIIFCQSLVNK
jgi:hypothetical protein